MHHCLNITEIFHHVTKHIAHRQTLLWMALTCHAFLDPAMARLWKSMDSFEPLVQLIPDHLRGCYHRDELVRTMYYPEEKSFTTDDTLDHREETNSS